MSYFFSLELFFATSPLLALLAGAVALEVSFFLSGGFIEVQPDTITLLSDVAERAEDIDEAEAERARELAERARDNASSDIDFSKAKAELAEEAARLQTLRKMRKKHGDVNRESRVFLCSIKSDAN